MRKGWLAGGTEGVTNCSLHSKIKSKNKEDNKDNRTKQVTDTAWSDLEICSKLSSSTRARATFWLIRHESAAPTPSLRQALRKHTYGASSPNYLELIQFRWNLLTTPWSPSLIKSSKIKLKNWSLKRHSSGLIWLQLKSKEAVLRFIPRCRRWKKMQRKRN